MNQLIFCFEKMFANCCWRELKYFCNLCNGCFSGKLIITYFKCCTENILLLWGKKMLFKIHFSNVQCFNFSCFSQFFSHLFNCVSLHNSYMPIFITFRDCMKINEKSVIFLNYVLDVACLIENNKQD